MGDLLDNRFYGFIFLGVIVWGIASLAPLFPDHNRDKAQVGPGVESPDGGAVKNRPQAPVLSAEEVRLRQAVADYSKQWRAMIGDDVPEIKEVARKTRVPAEAILASILVEDIRFFSPDWSSAFSYTFFKARLRKTVPDNVLVQLGHNPNPPPNRSFYGIVWDSTLVNAVQYLSSLPALDRGTRDLISSRTMVVDFWDDNDRSSPKSKHSYNFSTIERIAIVLKAQMEYWDRAGHDILSSTFRSVSTFGERIGVLITLNNIFSFHPRKKGHSAKESSGCSRCFRNSKRAEVPHRDPRLGGTNLWGWTNYGNVARVFVDMKIASNILELKQGP